MTISIANGEPSNYGISYFQTHTKVWKTWCCLFLSSLSQLVELWCRLVVWWSFLNSACASDATDITGLGKQESLDDSDGDNIVTLLLQTTTVACQCCLRIVQKHITELPARFSDKVQVQQKLLWLAFPFSHCLSSSASWNDGDTGEHSPWKS